VTNLHLFAILQGLIAVFLLAILFVALLASAIFLRTVVRRLLGFAEEEEESA
jgi:hypothetical protein